MVEYNDIRDLKGVDDIRDTGKGEDNRRLGYKIIDGCEFVIRVSDDFSKVFYQEIGVDSFGEIHEEKLIDTGRLQLGFYAKGVEHKLDDFEIID